VNEAVKSFNSVEEYIKVGFDMTTEVAFDFIENGQSECVTLILFLMFLLYNFFMQSK